MKKLLLTAAIVGGSFCFIGSAYAAPCGQVTTSSFDSVITTLQTELPSGSRSERRYKRNLIRATQSNINSSCSMAESMESSMGGIANVGMSNFFSAFSTDLSQITSILSQVKTLVSNPNPTTAQINQANTLIAQAKSMSDQVKQMARQMAKQLAESLEVNL
ncbi:MAG: hypothetical protein KA099_07680 [Alphaproteobacteria bacterium]|nr:hypothetical protein [Alphaproteobacteria bacterium]MBP7757877.1 hypothetical protein [Alphaproteobacteria bacterium]MBP7761204.1 hypothetical protein [Alphaproteobacteria bacterium]MBP7905190.1 hypothetical protein [Alphaproteobacteria bacterium]